jgi:uncharacterized RDD family membrane protein YckC
MPPGVPEGPFTPRAIGAKILEFPRTSTSAPPIRSDELAGPVLEHPRILEVPEVAPPPPALGGITIEPVAQREMEKRPGIDVPLQSAQLGRRLLAAFVDGLIVLLASALFGFIFWKVVGIQPPLRVLVKLGIGIPILLWAAYNYAMIVHSGTTPGLLLARLDLARFDGVPPSRRMRRMRVWASYLSAVSLGMGYLWVFLDEDVLCWHDRITHTYLAPRKPVA